MGPMATSIPYADELAPFLDMDLPSGWVRGLRKPLSTALQHDNPVESALFEALTGSSPDSTPISNAVIFAYLGGYDPSVDRPMNNARQLSVRYVADQAAFGVRAAFDERTVETAEAARDWLERAMPRVEQAMDRQRRFSVTLSDIHGLGPRGIGNLNEEYESLDAVAEATEAELIEIPYITEDLASEVLTAAAQFDGAVPTAPGDQAAANAADPLVIETGDLHPFSKLFED